MARNMSAKHDASTMYFLIPSRKARVAIEFTGRPSVLELAMSRRLPLGHSCGGMGTCTTCRVIVRSELTKLPPRHELDAEMARDREFREEERLSCQLEAYHDLEVEIPE
jgi:ferredoxin